MVAEIAAKAFNNYYFVANLDKLEELVIPKTVKKVSSKACSEDVKIKRK